MNIKPQEFWAMLYGIVKVNPNEYLDITRSLGVLWIPF